MSLISKSYRECFELLILMLTYILFCKCVLIFTFAMISYNKVIIFLNTHAYLLTDNTMGCCGTIGHIYLVVVNGLFMVSVNDSQKSCSIRYKKINRNNRMFNSCPFKSLKLLKLNFSHVLVIHFLLYIAADYLILSY